MGLINPVLTGALLAALTVAPDQIREPLLQQLRQHITGENIERLVLALKWIVGYGAVKSANAWLNELAQNNFRLRSEKSRYDWPKEIAVVTGACGGVGTLISKELALRGVKVMCLDIRDEFPDDMKDVKQLHYYKCDITDRQAVFDVAAKIQKEHGHPTILVNNAGVANASPVMTLSEKGVRQLFDVNIVAHYFTVQAFLPDMIKHNKGHVVSTASIASFMSPPGLVPYANTKAAVLALHEGLAFETRAVAKAPAIKFSILHPTFLDTAMAAPFKSNLLEAGAAVISPKLVADAAVKQIISCRSGQIILAGNLGPIAGARSWPKWLYYGIFYLGDKRTLKMAPPEFIKTHPKFA